MRIFLGRRFQKSNLIFLQSRFWIALFENSISWLNPIQALQMLFSLSSKGAVWGMFHKNWKNIMFWMIQIVQFLEEWETCSVSLGKKRFHNAVGTWLGIPQKCKKKKIFCFQNKKNWNPLYEEGEINHPFLFLSEELRGSRN